MTASTTPNPEKTRSPLGNGPEAPSDGNVSDRAANQANCRAGRCDLFPVTFSRCRRRFDPTSQLSHRQSGASLRERPVMPRAIYYEFRYSAP
jgi:hypothetical protein